MAPAPNFDIWQTQRASINGAWGPPTEVKGVNSTKNDVATWLSPDGCRLYLISDRGASTNIDIYVAERQR